MLSLKSKDNFWDYVAPFGDIGVNTFFYNNGWDIASTIHDLANIMYNETIVAPVIHFETFKYNT